MKVGFGLIGLLVLGTVTAKADPTYPITNLGGVIQSLDLGEYFATHAAAKTLKVAILDNSFSGYAAAIGTSLPAGTQYHAGPIPAPEHSQDVNATQYPEHSQDVNATQYEDHGLVMAEIVYGLMTNLGQSAQFAPEMHLYNTYGYTNFKAAVDDVIQRGMDIVLYSQVWEYGGNWDGKGFINAQVSRATEAGVLWVNASGDFGNTTFNSDIRMDTGDDWLSLPGQNHSVELDCAAPAGQTCPLRLVLSWNDFKDDVNVGTGKDLDLYLVDDEFNTIEASTLIQTTDTTPKPGYSLYPREIVETQLKPGRYFARVRNMSKNFGMGDRLRLTASGDFVVMPMHDSNETLLNPADNADAITVGATDSDKSSSSAKLQKPEIAMNSLITLASGAQYKGTSNSAAMAAGFFALVRSLHPAMSRGDLLNAFAAHHGSSPVGPGNGLPLEVLGFTFTGPGCFVAVDTHSVPVPFYIQGALADGGTLVETTLGDRILFPFDPITMMPGIVRQRFDDILVIGPPNPMSPNGTTGIFPRTMVASLNPALVEVLQTPMNQMICP